MKTPLTYDGEKIEPRSIDELELLARQGEGFQLEFKLKASHPDKIIREIAAFANTSGGLLLVGVDDDTTIKGVKFADEEEYVLVREIERGISPKIKYGIERVKLPHNREVLIFHIKEHLEKPFYAGDGQNKKVYVRVADKSIQASKEVREILKGLRKGKSLRFTYGEKETLLMKYLGEHKRITVAKFSEIADIPKKQASRTLILLVLTNVISYQAKETEDVFYLSPN